MQVGLTSWAAKQNRLSEMGLGVGKAVDGIGFREPPRLDRGKAWKMNMTEEV